ncbi:MAG TPA: cyclic pyranopterin monophosphate synthase MoaC [Lentisphaeria bacterium]|nr:MAG: molybdenum cofactor biosynthesis protein C [Lentisphaerae bacterium GWF2_38_69]HBM16638.1 cyclic pyranopterin monophosphate synthase MoaC [Lentisphaeria bacterium]
MNELSHIGNDNNPSMVDVSDKPDMHRVAKAEGFIKLKTETVKLIADNTIKKGNVLVTAELAGVMGAKKTPDLIPLCHSLNTTNIKVRAELKENGVFISSEVSCIGKTGVEMEALTAVSIALLTIYDMCKAVDKTMEIANIKLIEKTKANVK